MRARPWVERTFPVATNHRGRKVGVWLGVVLTAAVVLWTGLTTLASWISRGDLSPQRRDLLWMLGGLLVTFAAGLFDDYRPARTRGLVRQLAMLGRGSVTSGVVKLVAIVAASFLSVWMLGGRGLRLALGVPLVAGSANLWNLLDVVPGRALKWFLPAAVGLGVAGAATGFETLAAAAIGAAIPALVLDLREYAMLGDAGANVLGFVIGLGLFTQLATPWLAVALGAILLLHLLAETVSLSRLIEAVPPLRWFDQLGRIRDDSTHDSTLDG
jgi:hypothetical protein